MKKTDKEIVYSPSDLIRFMESPFASWMERCDLERPGKLERDPEDAESKLLTDAGNRHEEKFLKSLRDEGKDLCEIERGPDAFEQTARAIKDKREVIFQAALRMDSFSGFADFLVLGDDGSYEVWDTKLARKTKPYFLVQLCCYSEMLEKLVGKRPEIVRVVLGTNEEKAFRTDEHWRSILRRLGRGVSDYEGCAVCGRPDASSPRIAFPLMFDLLLLIGEYVLKGSRDLTGARRGVGWQGCKSMSRRMTPSTVPTPWTSFVNT